MSKVRVHEPSPLLDNGLHNAFPFTIDISPFLDALELEDLLVDLSALLDVR